MPARIETLKALHQMCSYHKGILMSSTTCACFYCCETFPPREIEEWCDQGCTALCPYCGIDSVLPKENPGQNIYLLDDTIQEMSNYWFDTVHDDKEER